MNTDVLFERFHIAPCGINCGTCLAYLRSKNRCDGCMSSSQIKVNHCMKCSIRNCELLNRTESQLCYECPVFPCQRLKKIDKRYRTRYRTSLIQNLRKINQTGMEDYLLSEITRWRCSDCGSALCVHRKSCSVCKKEYIDPEFINIS